MVSIRREHQVDLVSLPLERFLPGWALTLDCWGWGKYRLGSRWIVLLAWRAWECGANPCWKMVWINVGFPCYDDCGACASIYLMFRRRDLDELVRLMMDWALDAGCGCGGVGGTFSSCGANIFIVVRLIGAPAYRRIEEFAENKHFIRHQNRRDSKRISRDFVSMASSRLEYSTPDWKGLLWLG